MIARGFISLSGVLLLAAGHAAAQDRLGFVHDATTVSRIVSQMSELSAAEADSCQKAEDALVQSCKFYDDCESDIQTVYDARVGIDYFDDRFIVFDVLKTLSEKTEVEPSDNSEFLRSLGLDPSAYEGRIIQSASVSEDFDIELAKSSRAEFDRAMTQHKMCLSKIYKAAESLTPVSAEMTAPIVTSQEETGNGN